MYENCDVSRKEIGEPKKHLLKWHKRTPSIL